MKMSQTHEENEIGNNVLFVSATLHRWHGIYRMDDSKSSIVFEDDTIDGDLTTGSRWKLMPKVWQARFNTVQTNVNTAIDNISAKNAKSVKFPIRGVRVIARKDGPRFFSTLKEIEEEQLQPLVTEFVADFDRLKDTYMRPKAKTIEAWRDIEKHLPSTDKIAGRFWLEKVLVPISLGGDDKLDLLKGEEAVEYLNEIRRQKQAFASRVAGVITSGLEEELREAVDNLTNRIDAQGIVKAGTVDMVRNVFEKFNSFDFVLTDELRAKVKTAIETIDAVDPVELNKDNRHGARQIGKQLGEYLKGFADEATANLQAFQRRGQRAGRIRN
jgi:hypothetical protein